MKSARDLKAFGLIAAFAVAAAPAAAQTMAPLPVELPPTPAAPAVPAAPAMPSAPAPTVAVKAAPSTVQIETIDGLDLTQGSITAGGLAAIMTDVMLTDGRFAVIEGSSGSARYVLRGAVIRYDPAAGGAGVSVGGLSMLGRAAGAGAKTKTTTVGIALRLVDPTTGQVVAAAKANGSASGQEADAGLLNNRDGSTMGASAFRGTATAKAFEDALRKAVDELARKLAPPTP
jgi:curli biogenesis system outer membrane secretion channel CsgG